MGQASVILGREKKSEPTPWTTDLIIQRKFGPLVSYDFDNQLMDLGLFWL